MAADGTISDQPVEMLAADVREEGDGRELAVAKVVAALIGVPADDVRKRQAIADNRRIKLASAGLAMFAVLALVAAFLYWQHERQLAMEATRHKERIAREAGHDKQLADMQALIKSLIGASQAQAAPGAEKQVGDAVEAAVKGANAGDDRLHRALDLLKLGKPQEAEPLFRAVAEEKERTARASDKVAAAAYRNLGAIAGLADPKRARQAYAKAAALNSTDIEALLWRGWLEKEAGDLVASERALRHLLALKAHAPPDWHAYWAQLGLGDIAVHRGSLVQALEIYRGASAIADRLAKVDPANAGWQRDLSVSREKIGDVLIELGNLPDALESFKVALAIRDRLAKADPGNAQWQRDLSVSYDRIGDALRAHGNLTDALKSYRDSLGIRDHLTKTDPANAGWQRDLSVSHDSIGDVFVEQRNLTDALESYRDSLAIRDRLTRINSANAGWQRDLSVSHNKIGDVLVEQGNHLDGLRNHRNGLAIRDRLAKADPANAGWQRDLAVSHDSIGDALRAQGELTDALESYRHSLAIRDRLAKTTPANAALQRDLSVSHEKVGDVLRTQGNLAEALKSYQASLTARDALAKIDPRNVQSQHDVALSLQRVGLVAAQQRESALALDAYRSAFAIMQRLVALEPNHAAFKKDLMWFEGRIAALWHVERFVIIAKTAKAGRHEEAFVLQRRLAADIEKAEMAATGKPGTETASALGNVSWYALHARKFEDALSATERALALAGDLLWIETNRAHALLFLGRLDEARTLYLAHKGKRVFQEEEKAWEVAIAEDFEALRKAGLDHPAFAEILTALEK